MKRATSNLVAQQLFYSSKRDTVSIDDDILLQSSFGFESKVNMGTNRRKVKVKYKIEIIFLKI